METSLNSLSRRLDAFLFELASLHYRYGAGLSSELPLARLYTDYAELARPETFLQVREAVDDSRTDERARSRLRLLLEFLAGQVEDAIAAPAVELVANLEAKGVVPVEREPLPFQEAMTALSREAERERRGQLEKGLGEFLWENQGPYARWREAASQTAHALGYRSYLELRDAVTGFRAQPLAKTCDEVLAQTEDPYRDVLGYVLHRIDPGLRALPGPARRHDVQHAATAPWMRQHFPPEELLPSVTRCLLDMGLAPNAGGRIQLDTDERAGKSPRAFVADLQVPDELRLVVRPGGGLDDYFSLLHEFGHAQHLAHVAKQLPVEQRRLGDSSVTEAYAYLFDHFLLDEGWHRRYLKLSAPTAKEAARIAAFNNLLLLRRYCAKLPYELELYERGPVLPLAEVYEERMVSALRVGVHKGAYLHDVDPQLYAARYLRAWALEARLVKVLRERFNEDFWRNPAAGSWLKELFSRGQQENAEKLAQTLGGGPLSLAEAGQRLVEVMAA